MLALSLFFFYILLTGKQNNMQRQDETDVSGLHYNSDKFKSAEDIRTKCFVSVSVLSVTQGIFTGNTPFSTYCFLYSL